MAYAVEPRVSIVTPVYNGEAFLAECIESVLSQRYENWDYTVLNNCSGDSTREIADEFARRDPRIRVIDNAEFLGIIANHNEALRHISPESKYCKVLAADDLIYPDFLPSTVRVAESDPGVALVATYASDGKTVRFQGLPKDRSVVPGREAGRDNLLGGPYVVGRPTTHLYRSDDVRQRPDFYDEANIHADTEVCFELLAEGKLGFVHEVLAFMRVRDGSETSRAERIDTYRSGWLRVLVKHGHHYLSDQELEDTIQDHLRRYRRFLGAQVLKFRGREFWSFHRRQLAELGFPLGRFELLPGMLRFIGDAVLVHPLRTLHNLKNRVLGAS